MGIARLFEGPQSQFHSPSEMAAGQFCVAVFQRQESQMQMGLDKVGALREQPNQLLARDVGFPGLEHRFHLLQVFLAPAGTGGMDKFPLIAGGGGPPEDAEGPLPLGASPARATAGGVGRRRRAGILVGHGGCCRGLNG